VPTLLCGMALPFTTNIQTPTKYPLAWIYTFFPSPRVTKAAVLERSTSMSLSSS
jgi:hypothetical protein